MARNYGTIKLVDWPPQGEYVDENGLLWEAPEKPKPSRRTWEIKCEPQISILLKRLFPALSKQYGTLRLTHTPDAARDLEWFMFRYPMRVEPAKFLFEAAAAQKEKVSAIERLLAGKLLPAAPSLANGIVPWPLQSLAAEMAYTRGNMILGDDTGLGKAQPLSAKVLTPSGWTTIGSLRVGDEIVDPDGGKGFVEGVFYRGVRETYRVTTSDGATADCCDEHLWLIQTSNDRARATCRVLPLYAFSQKLSTPHTKGKNHQWRKNQVFIPLVTPCDFHKRELPISPWVLGALIGDGHLGNSAVSFSSVDAEILDRLSCELPRGVTLTKTRYGCDYRISRNESSGKNILLEAVRGLGLAGKRSWEKFIPDSYRGGLASDRLEFLRGLMDTDGDCTSEGVACFSTTSEVLATQVVEMVQSLGGMGTIFRKKAGHYRNAVGKDGPARAAYRVHVRIGLCPFYLPRKAERWRPNVLARSIRTVEHIGQQEMRCIAVSTKRNLYVTDGYIVTHNTLSAILLMLKPATLPAVVVTLTHLPGQWEQELTKCVDGTLLTHVIREGPIYDMTIPRKGRAKIVSMTPTRIPDVIIISYSKLHKWAETLALLNPKLVVFDEGQELRGEESDRRSAAMHLSASATWRLLLSATPFFNYGGEFWNVCEVVAPRELGTKEEFYAAWCHKVNNKWLIEDPVAFGGWLRESGLMLRRTRKEARRELPGGKPLPILQHVETNVKKLNELSGDLRWLARTIMQEKESYQGQRMSVSGQFDMKMRQSCGIAKMPFVAEFIKLLLESEPSVLVMAWHRECFSILLEKLAEYRPVMFTGSESQPQKQLSKDLFVSGKSRVMLMSLRAGAGIDGLQHACRTIVFGELDWSPAVSEQNIGRLAREGQQDVVVPYYMISQTIADQKMAEVLGLKRSQINGVRDGDVEMVEKIQRDGSTVIRSMAEAYLASIGEDPSVSS